MNSIAEQRHDGMSMRMRLETGLSLSLAAGTHPMIDREIARSLPHVRVL